jgi:hypothetical protein
VLPPVSNPVALPPTRTVDEDYILWIRWSEYQSYSAAKPDRLWMQVVEVQTFTGMYSIAVKVLLRKGTEWLPHYLPLKAVDSPYGKLLNLWETSVKADLLKPGVFFILETYLRKSTKSDWPVRDYKIVSQESPPLSTSVKRRKREGGEKAE